MKGLVVARRAAGVAAKAVNRELATAVESLAGVITLPKIKVRVRFRYRTLEDGRIRARDLGGEVFAGVSWD